MDLSIIAILNIKSADYCCIISRISKGEAISLMQNINLTKKRGQNIKNHYCIEKWENKVKVW